MIRLVGALLFCFALNTAVDSTEVKLRAGLNLADEGEFPYQVSIQLNGEHLCGGVLITYKHVVTAAACLSNVVLDPNLLSQMRIHVGSVHLKSKGYLYELSRVSIHSEFQFSEKWVSTQNDIGIAHIRGQPTSLYGVKPINLPGFTEIPLNTYMVFTGWGDSQPSSKQSVDVLHKSYFKAISNEKCQKYYSWKVQPYQFCTAPDQYANICKTDWGGPLVYNGQLVGISSGLRSCGNGNPEVFTKVSFYLKYLLDEVNFPSL